MTGNLPSFDAFFEALWDVRPFPWQRRLAEQALAGRWPRVIAVPTGLGKTAVIDIVLYALAAQATRPPQERTVPLRIFWVVNRRLLVDSVFDRAETARRILSTAPAGTPLYHVATALRSLWRASDGDPPFAVVRLHGAVPTDPIWLPGLHAPAVVSCTPDQFVSRLLHRPFGASQHMAPVNAALVGYDALVVFDEAHLAEPAAQTTADAMELQSADDLRDHVVAAGLPWRPPVVIRCTATPRRREGEEGTLALDGDDKTDHEVTRRLAAARPVRLLTRTGNDLPLLMGGWVEQRLAEGRRTIACVTNTVGEARRVHAAIDHRLRVQAPDAVVLLFHGQTREADRRALVDQWLPRLRAGRQYAMDEHAPVVVVSTQVLEVGADLDFDAMITEAAPLDALLQRFGRLNRLGRLPHSEGAIAPPSEPDGNGRPDPVYGDAARTAWAWIRKRSTRHRVAFDLGPKGVWHQLLDEPAESVAILTTLRPPAPRLSATAAWLFAASSPPGTDAGDIEPYVHGLIEDLPTATVCWRAELNSEPGILDSNAVAWLEAVPPSAHETVDVPLHEARTWVERQLDSRRLLLILTEQGWEPLSRVAQVGARTTIACATEAGGLDAWGWNPHSSGTVPDLGGLGRIPRIRLSRPFLRSVLAAMPQPVAGLIDNAEDLVGLPPASRRHQAKKVVDSLRDALGTATIPRVVSTRLREALDRVASDPDFRISSRSRTALAPTVLLVRAPGHRPSTGEFPLRAHHAATAWSAWQACTLLGLRGDVRRAAIRAATIHDAGKGWPRFQALLRGSSELEAAVATRRGQLLAKSIGGSSRSAFLPRGFRHEMLSTLCAEAEPASTAPDATDQLVRHLIAAHHGWGRPHLPVALNGADARLFEVFVPRRRNRRPRRISLNATPRIAEDQAIRFDTLVRLWGPWILAFLEAIVRFADYDASAGDVEEGP